MNNIINFNILYKIMDDLERRLEWLISQFEYNVKIALRSPYNGIEYIKLGRSKLYALTQENPFLELYGTHLLRLYDNEVNKE